MQKVILSIISSGINNIGTSRSIMKFKKVVETSLYSSDLEAMKEFYVAKLGLEFVSEQVGRHVFLKTQKNMLLLFNPEATRIEKHTIHGAITPPAMVHIALEIEDDDYECDAIIGDEKHRNRKDGNMGE